MDAIHSDGGGYILPALPGRCSYNSGDAALALVIIPGANCPSKGYLPVAAAIQHCSKLAIWVAIPSFWCNIPVQIRSRLRAVRSAMEAEGLPLTAPNVLLGHSLGGWMAMCYAECNSDDSSWGSDSNHGAGSGDNSCSACSWTDGIISRSSSASGSSSAGSRAGHAATRLEERLEVAALVLYACPLAGWRSALCILRCLAGHGGQASGLAVPCLTLGPELDGVERLRGHQKQDCSPSSGAQPPELHSPVLLLEGLSHWNLSSGEPPCFVITCYDLRTLVTAADGHAAIARHVDSFLTALFDHDRSRRAAAMQALLISVERTATMLSSRGLL